MAKARKVYIDPSTGKHYALFIGENVKSYIIQDTFPASTVEIVHNQNTNALIPRLYSSPENEELLPNNFRIIDENTVQLSFSSTFTGTIKLLFFNN